MKTFQTEAEIPPDGRLVLNGLPFAPGERVAVSIGTLLPFKEMREYAERLAQNSHDFVQETNSHVMERLLSETEW